MRYNLFVAYDLNSPEQDYDAVHAAVKSLGLWHQFQMSFFYVNTEASPAEAFALIASVASANDRLAVIDANSGVVSNWDRPPIREINAIWHTL